jgi:hypothetical protein
MSDITNNAYSTTWGTIRITNLFAASRPETSKSSSVEFKAFVNSFRDSFNPGWSEQLFPNQSSPIAHQVSPKRTIQLSFSVPSYDAQEAIVNMRKCTFLAESMYPILKREGSGTHSLKSTFMGIKFANLIQNSQGGLLPGYIMGFVFVPNLDHGVHIDTKAGFNKNSALAEMPGGEESSYIIPKLIEIDLTFTPMEMRESFGYQVSEGGSFFGNQGSWANDGARPYGTKIVATAGQLPASMGSLAPNSKVSSIVDAAADIMFD